MVVSERVCSRKALVLFNKSYGFVLQKLWSCTTKDMVLYYKRYGLVLQKIWCLIGRVATDEDFVKSGVSRQDILFCCIYLFYSVEFNKGRAEKSLH